MPRKSLFRGNRQNNEQISSPITKPITTNTVMNSWTEAALEKANTAVLYDYTGSPKPALDAYKEAIDLLDKVFGSATESDDQSRLKKIYDSYLERVAILTRQLQKHDELDDSITIPIAHTPKVSLPPLPPKPSTSSSTKSTRSQHHRRPPSLILNDSQNYQKDIQPPTPNSNNSTFYFDSKTPHTPPPPLPSKSPKVLPPKSPSGSLFGSIFMKKQSSKESVKPKTANPVFSMPTPSKSTPTLSMNRSTLSWKKNGSKKKQRRSIELDSGNHSPFSASQIELPSLELPNVDIPKDDDYFDLQSNTETKNMLYSRPESMLTSLRDLHEKANDIPTHEDVIDHSYNDNNNITSVSRTNSVHKNQQQQQLFSSASSVMTTNSSFTRSIYSPTRSSFYSNSFSYKDDDEYSIISSKYPPAQSFLFSDTNMNNTTSSFFTTGSTDIAMESLAKVLAESAATMPDRSKRTNGTVAPSIPAVIEEPEPELSSSSSLTANITANFLDTPYGHQQQSGLSRSPSAKSVSSAKSRGSSHGSNESNNNNLKEELYSSSSPSTPSGTKDRSFWTKRSKPTKQKTLKTVPPLHLDHHKSHESQHGRSVESTPSTPKSTTTSVSLSLLSPTMSLGSAATTTSSKRLMTHYSHAFGVYVDTAMKNKGIDVSVALESTTSNKECKQPKLMARLLQSMEEGGYITDRIHAPKQLWYQTQVRLPSIDAKISSCEQILALLQHMHSLTQFLDVQQQKQQKQRDAATEGLHDLVRLEQILDQIKQTFGKAHYDHSKPGNSTTTFTSQHQQHSSSPTYQASSALSSLTPSFSSTKIVTATTTNSLSQDQSLQSKPTNSIKDPVTTWSSKLSKSVERMKIETKSSEEQIHAYIQTLIRLFSMTTVLDEWRDQCMEMTHTMSMDKAYVYDQLLQKTMMCSGTLHTVVCGFVMRDFAILLNKWLKRHREWMWDD